MISRRHFLRTLAAATAAMSLTPAGRADEAGEAEASDRWGRLLPRRPLGRTGEWVTILGVGGGHLGQMEEAEAERAVEAAIEEGVRFFDTAESYSRGRSERFLGRFLTPKYRDESFLMSKTKARDGATAQQHLDESLQRLNTDRLDLWQIHEINTPEDVDSRVEQGVLDVFLKAKADDKARYIGFSGHRTPAAQKRMLEVLASRGIEFDAAQHPVNVLDAHHESFTKEAMPALLDRGYGILAMKTLAYGQLLGKQTSWVRGRQGEVPATVPERLSLEEALGFVWSLPVSTLITGASNVAELRHNAGVARAFAGMTDERRQQLVDAVADSAGPNIEFYKA